MAAAVVMTDVYTVKIYLIDLIHMSIKGCANFPYSVPYKIKDLAFFPNSTIKFVTCGIENLTVWELKGNILSYSCYEMNLPSEMSSNTFENERIQN